MLHASTLTYRVHACMPVQLAVFIRIDGGGSLFFVHVVRKYLDSAVRIFFYKNLPNTSALYSHKKGISPIKSPTILKMTVLSAGPVYIIDFSTLLLLGIFRHGSCLSEFQNIASQSVRPVRERSAVMNYLLSVCV